MNRISAWSINHPIPTVILFLVLTLAGLYGYSLIRVNNTPDIDFPTVTVTVTQPGASPTELDTQVTQVIENSVSNLSGVESVDSAISEGLSTTTISFAFGTEVDRATNDVRNAVTGVQGQLPASASTPTVSQVEFTGGAILTLIVSGANMSPDELTWFVDNTLSDEITGVPGVGSVSRSGGVDRLIRVELDPDRLASLNLTAGDVSQSLYSVNVTRPGGRVTFGSLEQTVRTVGTATTVEALADVEISLPGGGDARLADLGKILDTWSEPRQLARFNGAEVIAINVYRSPVSSEVHTTEWVREKVTEIDEMHDGVTITEATSSSHFVEESFDAAVEALLLGAALAVVVVFLFLRDIRATLISAVAIPLSLIPTFAVMAWLDLSFNTFTLLGLSLVVGVLVDDAIVEIENIVRHMRESGKGAREAALEAADEIGLAVVATTATLLAVFIPVSLMPGIAGQFFKSFGIVVATSVFSSLVVARMLTPLMGAYLVKAGGAEHRQPVWLSAYLWVLRRALRFRAIAIVICLAFFGVSIYLATQSEFAFLPQSDQGRVVVSVELPPGATLEQTDFAIQAVIAIFAEAPEVSSSFATIGTPVSSGFGASSAGQVNSGQLTLNLVPQAERTVSQQEFQARYADALLSIPGARVRYSGDSLSSVSVNLVGDDPELLNEARDQLVREMRTITGLRNVTSDSALAQPELVVTPDVARAAELGITAAQIANAVSIATLGESDENLTKLSLNGQQISVRVALAEGSFNSVEEVGMLPVRGTQITVPLASIAAIEFGAGPSSITRVERNRSVTLSAELEGLSLGDATAMIAELSVMKDLPPGVEQLPAGDAQLLSELLSGFILVVVCAVLLMYLTLVLLFKGFFQPIAILFALPLSMGGALALLYLTGNAIGLTALIGILMLLGLAAKNSILLVEYAIMAQSKGIGRTQALLDAASKRARPIVMTSIAMAAGMLPIALGIGADAETRAPMAIAVIGGLVSSTVLSLVFIPVVYTLFQSLEGRVGRLLSRLLVDQKAVTPQPAARLKSEAAPKS